MLRNSANNLIILEKISFAGVLIRKFLVGHWLTGIVQEILYGQDTFFEPFPDKNGFTVNKYFFVVE